VTKEGSFVKCVCHGRSLLLHTQLTQCSFHFLLTIMENQIFIPFCEIKTNKMHFTFLIYWNILFSTCFEMINYSSSVGTYCICSI